eukprot:CAMPEP_0174871108 /NCGR_PEP_ID=MMETSP1114-20130205/70885_1 /TAXON_ID=312471 /ORGANISM="Neobodo designis, Strain CCAP 1951/1" /LENGTH=438 /DNA_ID=CAMNT_0016106385 /DNA_START=37 /DNA_END=1353 /DNA_ORIENTATION=-
MARSIIVALCLVIMCAIAITSATVVGGSSAVPLTRLWRVDLSTATSFGPDDAAKVGRASRSGDFYFTTDVDGALWAVNTTSGTVAWRYSSWPAPPRDVERTRQISAGPEHVLVLRNRTAFALNTTTGELVWTRPVSAEQVSQGGIWVNDVQVLIAGYENFEVWNVSTGQLLWRFDHLWTPSYGAVAVSHDGSNQVAALKRTWGANGKADVHIVLLNRANGAVINQYPLSPKVIGTAQPQIFQLTSDYILVYTQTGIYKMGLVPGVATWNTTVSFTPEGYGLGSPYIYLRTATSLYSYELATGRPVSSINMTATLGSGFQFVRHLWGFNTFASLGLIFKDAATNATSMRIVGINAANMSIRYNLAPPTASSLNDYGNDVGIGTIVIPYESGATVIDRSGATGTIAGCKWTVPASVEVGPDTVTLTDHHGVAAYKFDPNI